MPSEETQFKKGMTPWNKGTVGLKKSTSGSFKKGYVPWNKGKRSPLKGRKRDPEIGKKISLTKNRGLTKRGKLERYTFYRLYTQKVFLRDDYTCQICGDYGGNLHVDHIKKWSDYPELRFELDNCRTLCRPCHYYVTFKRKMPSNSAWGLRPNHGDRI